MGPKLFSKESQEGFWSVADSIYESVENADAIVILTEWEEFKHIDWSKCSKIMRSPSWLFDTRSVADYKSASTFGINMSRFREIMHFILQYSNLPINIIKPIDEKTYSLFNRCLGLKTYPIF